MQVIYKSMIGRVVMKGASQSIIALALLATLLVQPARAIEVGDVFFVSNGTGNTVTSIVKRDADGIELIAQSLQVNAAEYCERYEQLKPLSAKMRECLRQNRGQPRRFKVVCRTKTIVTDTGSYRPGGSGGPWLSVANANWIIQGDDLYGQACKHR
jgi:hypothetical protein